MMAIPMRIDSCSLITGLKRYEFSFDRACTVLDGPVGTGKSSLLELIKYGLGGSGVLTPVVKGEVRRVELDLRLAGQRIRVSRGVGIGSDEVSVLDLVTQELVGVFPVRPRVNAQPIGEELLKLMGFPTVRIPRSRTRATAASVPLTFNDLYAYLYVEQKEIDRSVVFHREQFREPKRRALFELMFKLSSERQLEYETRLGALNDSIRASQAEAKSIAEFLNTAKVPPRLELERRRIDEMAARDAAVEQLRLIRARVHTETSGHDQLREDLRILETQLLELQRAVAGAEVEVARREELLAQLQVDLQREDKAAAAALRLSPLEFVVCPRCLQDIEPERADPGHCTLCLQAVEAVLEYSEEADPAFEQTVQQIDEQDQMLRHAREDLSNRSEKLRAVATRVDSLRQELGYLTSDSVSPRFDEIELVSASRARAEGNLSDALRMVRFWENLDEVEARVSEMQQAKVSLESLLEEERSALRAHSQVIQDLSHQFHELVTELGIPWAREAWIDERTFLPIVDGNKFEDLAVAGGTLTAVTVAYHLTLIGYSLAQSDCLLPGILILDTPRKNLGSNPDDRAMADKIYRHIRSLCDYHGMKIQFIIADNDVPSAPDWFGKIHFDYDRPLIDHVAHPGEDAVLAGEVPLVGARSQD